MTRDFLIVTLEKMIDLLKKGDYIERKHFVRQNKANNLT